MITKFIDIGDVVNFYLTKSQEILSRMHDAVVLKTDCWNEVHCDEDPRYKPIVGNLPNVKEIVCIEIDKNLVDRAKEKSYCKDADIICDSLITHRFPEEKFDVILDLSTIDHIHPLDTETVIRNYGCWLKPDGILFVVVWLTKDTNVAKLPREISFGHQYYINIDEFPRMLNANGFEIVESELISPGKPREILKSFLCRKVSI